MFSYISPEKRVPTDHPLRPIRRIVDEILKEMSPKFQKLYSDVGQTSKLRADGHSSWVYSTCYQPFRRSSPCSPFALARSVAWRSVPRRGSCKSVPGS